MKRIKIGSVELLGYLGIFLWGAIILLRGTSLTNNGLYLFMLGILPNLAAAWAITMSAKWVVLFIFKRSVTIKIHFCICLAVIILALISEMIHDMFLGAPFDIYDMLLTVVAQLFIFLIPMLTKDRYFSDYN